MSVAVAQSPSLAKTPSKVSMRQGTLAGFIKTPTSGPALKSSREVVFRSVEDEYMVSGDEEEEQYIEEDEQPARHVPENKSKSTIDGGANVKGPMDMRHLPPINDLNHMFSDLIDNPALKGIEQLLERLNGRKLRVATMCSGTESPLLALSMIAPLVEKKYGKPLEIEHVFSCEIEPFKQAYIERNFSPPILFRDVCELGNDEATTAYGAKVKVPGNVDILIAGTSCVDFSNLNNSKQSIDGEGESGATFKGMINWVERHRPTIVIVENVLSAPWEKSVCPKFRRIDYAAEWIKLDTKAFYIPHTRCRGYMCAIDLRTVKGKSKEVEKSLKLNGRGNFTKGASDSAPAQWKHLVKELERPASSPIEAFLLPEDDPRIVRTRASFQDALSNRSTIDWARCEVRHRDARFAEEIGEKRPLTLWQEGGGCALPDFAWNDWAVTQPERVLDLMDISTLRYAVKGVDSTYKTIVWNLSQNVDRIGYPKGGLSPCMTPTMIPYISNRGGPLTGYEALGMQGLPVDRLLLTRESEDNCMDLAGNAMSTTVVGSCIMAALILATDQLKLKHEISAEQIIAAKEQDKSQISDFVGEDRLVQNVEDLAHVEKVSISQLLSNAQRSRRLCDCEGRAAQTNRKIVQCQDCGFTACSKCQGRPEHNYPRLVNGEVDLNAFEIDRLDPKQFEKEFKQIIPMRLSFPEGSAAHLSAYESKATELGISRHFWQAWLDGCIKAFSRELRFRALNRQEVWSATWDSEFAHLELLLDPKQPEWRLFVKPDPKLQANSEIRAMFGQPVARLSLDSEKAETLLTGSWDICLPSTKSFDVTLSGGQEGTGETEHGVDDHGDLVPSWEMSLGLLAREFRAKRVWKFLDIETDDAAATYLDVPIDGRYDLIDKCGCASNSLHRKQDSSMYFFLDPKRCSGGGDDYFVFSLVKRRLLFGETRPVAARLHPNWRQFGQALSQGKIIRKLKSKITIDGHWIKAQGLKLDASLKQEALICMPDTQGNFSIDVSQGACAGADALLTCRLPLTMAEAVWTRDWTEVDHIHERQIFGAVSWLTERLRGIPGLDQWMQLDSMESLSQEVNCERCAPSPPEVFFGEVFYRPKSKTAKCTTKIQGVEDIGEAGRFEHLLKNRPVPFATQLRLLDGNAEFRIGLNVASLIHQALARLPKGPRLADLTWRLDTNYVEKQRLVLPTFKKALEQTSNRNEVEAEQPPHFKIPLRKEQLRSLTWMLRQESSEAKPWVEQEIVEAMLGPLKWRAEAKASRKIDVLGGVLADEVGYGKTAITLGLIDSSPNCRVEFADEYGYISTRATLIVVPGHLIKQWPSEITKFLGKQVKTISIESASHLKQFTIEDYLEADIVCVSGTLLKNKTYLGQLGALAGGVNLPSNSDKGGRYFNQKHAEAMLGLKQTVECLKQNNAKKAWDEMTEGRPETLATRKAIFIQKKRMKGRAFRESRADERVKLQAAGKAPPVKSVLKVSDSAKKEPPKASSSKPKSKPRPKHFEDEEIVEELAPRSARLKRSRVISISDDEEDNVVEILSDASLPGTTLPAPTDREVTPPSVKESARSFEVVIKQNEAWSKVTGKSTPQKTRTRASNLENTQNTITGWLKGTNKRPAPPSDVSSTTEVPSDNGSEYEAPESSDDNLDDEEMLEVSSEAEPSSESSAEESEEEVRPKKKTIKRSNQIQMANQEEAQNHEENTLDDLAAEPQLMDLDGLNEDDLDENGNIIDVNADITEDLKKDRGVDVNHALETNPWRLGSKAVERDYRQMKSPVLEMFKFNRFVIDEYTYLKDKLHKMTMNMKSDRRWILSGTPPLEDFMAIKTISVFLGVELGINDIPTNLKARKNWFNEFTAVEKFHSFRETKSFEWHTERHRQAGRFLKQFMRQNKPEINEIPSTEKHHKIILPAAERAIYLELLHHLQALDMNIKKNTKAVSDRDRRITESFGESQTAEEALIKRCAHFDYSTNHDQEDNAIYECDRLVETRTRQLRECEVQLHTIVWELFEEEYKDTKGIKQETVGLFDKDSIFRTWLMHMKTNGTSDGDASARIRRMIDACEASIKSRDLKKPVLEEYKTDAVRRQRLRYNKKKTKPLNKIDSMSQFLTAAQKKQLAMGKSLASLNEEKESASSSASEEEEQIRKPKKKQQKITAKSKSKLADSDDDEPTVDAGDKLIARQPDWMDVKKGLFKDKSHMLKRIEKELVGRVKSLRFFEVVRDVQRLNSTTIPIEDKPDITFMCPGPNCKHRDANGHKRPLALKDVCVFSTCGHSGCYECLREYANDQKCPEADCLAPGILNVIVKSTSLGEEEDIKNELVAGKHWGTKIEQICDLIKDQIPKDEKIILFCQFKDLTETVDDALHDKGIDRIRITGSASAKSKALLSFQDPKARERVLVLQADDESASGANLTVANHVIFVSPLLAETSGQYQAQETQAIGRVKRFGQKRHVYVHRFLTLDTIDIEIFEKREKEKAMLEEDDGEEY